MKLLRLTTLSLILSLSLTACGSKTNPTTSLQSNKSSTQQTSAIASTNPQSTSTQTVASTQQSQSTQTKNDQSQVQASIPSSNDTATTKESQNNDATKQSSVQAASSTTSKETSKTSPEVKTETKQEESVKIISVTSPAARNSTATLKAKVKPGATASIVVHYKSGASKAAGLEPKKADSNGNVSWSWHVGGNTTLGNWRITISSGNSSAETYFEVVH